MDTDIIYIRKSKITNNLQVQCPSFVRAKIYFSDYVCWDASFYFESTLLHFCLVSLWYPTQI